MPNGVPALELAITYEHAACRDTYCARLMPPALPGRAGLGRPSRSCVEQPASAGFVIRSRGFSRRAARQRAKALGYRYAGHLHGLKSKTLMDTRGASPA